MKKQKIQFIVILIVLAVLIAATFGMKWYNKNKEEEKTAEEEASTIYISKVDVDTITAFSYEVDHVTYTFTKDGDTWTYDGDTSLDMDEEAIDSMLSTLSSLTAIEEISDYTDLKEFGFDQPEDLISYTTSEGSVSLFVGNKNDTLNAYYIISADGGSIYLTETSLADAFSKTIEELTVTEDTESTETVEHRRINKIKAESAPDRKFVQVLIFLMRCSIFFFGIFFDQLINKTVCPDQNRDDHRSINRCHEHVHKIFAGRNCTDDSRNIKSSQNDHADDC